MTNVELYLLWGGIFGALISYVIGRGTRGLDMGGDDDIPWRP